MFRVHLDTANAVFDPDAAPEVARMLVALADDVRRVHFWTDLGPDAEKVRIPLRDANGNGVGFAIFLPDTEE